jgi:predicted DsbA family dithiol-disulfide isomerase
MAKNKSRGAGAKKKSVAQERAGISALKQKQTKQRKARQNKIAIISLLCVGAIAIVIVVIALTSSKSGDGNGSGANSASDNYLNKATVEGSLDAQNHFVEYNDVFCPYCYKFFDALNQNTDSFKADYLDTKKLNLEIRVTDALADTQKNGENDISTVGGKSTYCAANQDKFFTYFIEMQKHINNDYYSKGIGAYHGAPEIKIADPTSYFLNIANAAGLDTDKFSDCMKGQDALNQLKATTNQFVSDQQTEGGGSGLPYFLFNDYKSSGFQGDYDTIKKMFQAGGVS